MMVLEVAAYLVLGAVCGFAFLRYAVRMPFAERRVYYASGIVVASFVYVAFAMASMESTWLIVEIAGVLLFLIFVLLGQRRSPAWLAAGWLLHIAWDASLHLAVNVHFVPIWYPVACISFDAVVGISIARTLVRPASTAEAVA